MNTPENQQDQFLKSLFKEVEVTENKSITEKVMQDINVLPDAKPIVYEPPIGKRGWVLIGLLFTILFGCALLMESSFTIEPSELSYIPMELMERLTNGFNLELSLQELPHFSTAYLTAMMAFIVFGVYFMISYWRVKKT